MVWDILHLSDYLAIHRIDIHDCFLMNILIMGFISLISQFYDMLGLWKNSKSVIQVDGLFSGTSKVPAFRTLVTSITTLPWR
jgi:hypothetical protein